MRLLVTRPEPDGKSTAARLRALGHDVVVAPVLRLKAVAASFGPGPFAALIITSRNAARALATHARRDEIVGLPVFAVGERSAEAARAAGLSDVVSADGDGDDLVRLVAARFAGSGARLLYLAGEDRAGDLAGSLAAHGIAIETAIVYRAVAERGFSRRLAAGVAAGPLDAVLHYSPRSAEAFLAGAEAAGLTGAMLAAVHLCLSADVAAPLEAAGAAQVRIGRHNGLARAVTEARATHGPGRRRHGR